MASLGLWATVKHMENAILVSQEDTDRWPGYMSRSEMV